MADLRGGSTVGGRPILGKEARDNYLGKIVGNRLKESLIYDDGSKVTVSGVLTATTLQESGSNLSSRYLGISNNAVSASKLATSRTISLTGDMSGSASFDGSSNISITTTISDDSHNHIIANVDGLQTELDKRMRTDANTSTTGTLGATNVWANSGDDYAKFRIWGNSSTYGHGMVSGISYGYLNDFAMTFQMNNDTDRGFWWGYEGQAKTDGAMSLTTDGRLYVKNVVNAGAVYSRGTLYENSTPISSTYALKAPTDSHINDTGIHKSWGYFDTNGGQDFRARGKRVIVATTSNLVMNYGNDFTMVDIQSPVTTKNLDVLGNIAVTGSINFNNGMLISNDGGTTNIDHIWHDDGTNSWHFVSDGASKQEGNSNLVSKRVKTEEVYGRYIDTFILRDHMNGNVTLSAMGSDLYLGYQNTSAVRLATDVYANDGISKIINCDGTSMGVSNHANMSANVLLNFYNNIPRIRYGGAGAGADNGFQIVGSGDAVKMEVTQGGHVLAYGGYFKSGTGGNVVLQSDNGYCVVRAGGTENIYLQTLGNVRVVQPNSTSSYMPILASQFSVNSVESAKENIVEFEESALDMIKNKGKIYEYDLKVEADSPNRKRKIGFVIGREVPSELTDNEEEGVDIYAMNSVLWKAVQELTNKVESLENQLASAK